MKKTFVFAGLVLAILISMSYFTQSVNLFIQLSYAKSTEAIIFAVCYLLLFIAVTLLSILGVVTIIKARGEDISLVSSRIFLLIAALIILVLGQTLNGINAYLHIKAYNESLENATGALVDVLSANKALTIVSFLTTYVGAIGVLMLSILSFKWEKNETTKENEAD